MIYIVKLLRSLILEEILEWEFFFLISSVKTIILLSALFEDLIIQKKIEIFK